MSDTDEWDNLTGGQKVFAVIVLAFLIALVIGALGYVLVWLWTHLFEML